MPLQALPQLLSSAQYTLILLQLHAISTKALPHTTHTLPLSFMLTVHVLA